MEGALAFLHGDGTRTSARFSLAITALAIPRPDAETEVDSRVGAGGKLGGLFQFGRTQNLAGCRWRTSAVI